MIEGFGDDDLGRGLDARRGVGRVGESEFLDGDGEARGGELVFNNLVARAHGDETVAGGAEGHRSEG
jgi:hypothetical protein